MINFASSLDPHAPMRPDEAIVVLDDGRPTRPELHARITPTVPSNTASA